MRNCNSHDTVGAQKVSDISELLSIWTTLAVTLRFEGTTLGRLEGCYTLG
jgi:hypothetical protein